MKCKIILAFAFFFVSEIGLQAQEILTVEEAVKITLENNFEIKIAANEYKIDQQNVSLANAGILPSLNANVINNNSVLDTKQTQLDGTGRELDNARNLNLTYGVALNWTVFDGMRMFARHKQLKELEKLGDAELKLTILTRISDVITTYYDIVQQQQQLTALDTTIIISNVRVKTAKNRYTIGKASKLEVLNAEVDLNTDATAFLRQKETYTNTKILLNQIMARDPNIDFKVIEEVQIENNLVLRDLMVLAEKQNPQLQTQVINKRIAELELKQIKGNRYPTIALNSGYNFTRSEASLGFITQSSGRGFVYGINATMNIFNGGLQNRNERIAKLQVENSKILIDQQKLAHETQLSAAYQTYRTNLQLSKLEAKSEEIAKQNMDITFEKFRIGTITTTTLEFRTAQINFINAKVRSSNAQFQAKISEVALRELAGNLSFK